MNDREEDMLVPVRPGEILADEFMQPLGLSANKLARKLGVPPNRISEIIKGRRSISADTALRLSQAFGTSPEFWLNLQQAVDLWNALHSDKAGELNEIQPAQVA